AGARRSTAAARRVLRRHLRMLGSHPIGLTAAASLAAGSTVHLRGIARPMPPSRVDTHIWRKSTLETGNLRFLVEEGHDFLLFDRVGGSVCVIAAGGHLINADRLLEGEEVSVFGCIDRIADPRAEERSPNGRGGLALAVRSSADHPL